MDIHQAFKMGARKLAADNKNYSTLHKSHGIEQFDWELLTQSEYWTGDQAQKMRNVMAQAVEVSMTIAGMPAIPLPGQYVAALISEIVAPCNRMLACMKAPDTFDAVDASGIVGTHEVKAMPKEQLMALVLAYSGGYGDEPRNTRVSRKVNRQIAQANEK